MCVWVRLKSARNFPWLRFWFCGGLLLKVISLSHQSWTEFEWNVCGSKIWWRSESETTRNHHTDSMITTQTTWFIRFISSKKAIFHRKGIFFSRYSVVICGTSTPTGNLRGCVNLLEIITNNSVQIIFMCNPDITSVCVSMFESVKVDFVKGRQRHSILKFFFSAAVGVIVHHLTERAAYRCTHTLWPRTANGTERLS